MPNNVTRKEKWSFMAADYTQRDSERSMEKVLAFQREEKNDEPTEDISLFDLNLIPSIITQ